MRHMWKVGDTHFNFCVKCGIKKSAAWVQKCPMPDRYIDKKLPHDVATLKGAHGQEIFVCQSCEMVRSETRKIIFSKDNSHCGYIPYILTEYNGKKIAQHTMHLIFSFSKSKLKSWGKPEVAYWPIYCSLTQNDIKVKDIIK